MASQVHLAHTRNRNGHGWFEKRPSLLNVVRGSRCKDYHEGEGKYEGGHHRAQSQVTTRLSRIAGLEPCTARSGRDDLRLEEGLSNSYETNFLGKSSLRICLPSWTA